MACALAGVTSSSRAERLKRRCDILHQRELHLEHPEVVAGQACPDLEGSTVRQVSESLDSLSRGRCRISGERCTVSGSTLRTDVPLELRSMRRRAPSPARHSQRRSTVSAVVIRSMLMRPACTS